MGSFDAGRAVREYLVAHHAFEECDVPGRLFRVVDQQHALVFHDGLAHVGPRGGYTEVRAQLHVARRDLNELIREILDLNDPWAWEWWPTFDVTRHLGIEWAMPQHPSATPTYFKGPEEWMERWIDSWLPLFEEKAPSMAFLMDVFARNSNRDIGHKAHRRKFTAMLDGWTDADEEEFLAPVERFLADPESHESAKELPRATFVRLVANRRSELDRTRAWLAEHPNGIERELMD